MGDLKVPIQIVTDDVLEKYHQLRLKEEAWTNFYFKLKAFICHGIEDKSIFTHEEIVNKMNILATEEGCFR